MVFSKIISQKYPVDKLLNLMIDIQVLVNCKLPLLNVGMYILFDKNMFQ